MMQRVGASRSLVKQLIIKLWGFDDDGVENLKTFSTTMFSLIPSIQKLQLWDAHARPMKEVAVIIVAAKERCPHLKCIVLPPSSSSGKISNSDVASLLQERIQTIVDPVIEGPNARNLRELGRGIPFAKLPQSSEILTKFLMRLGDVCPDLEVVTHAHDVGEEMDAITSDEQWLISGYNDSALPFRN